VDDFIEWEVSLITDEEIELRLQLLLLNARRRGYPDAELGPC
jgi:hypothetical protein